jgi:hypothetical protein
VPTNIVAMMVVAALSATVIRGIRSAMRGTVPVHPETARPAKVK